VRDLGYANGYRLTLACVDGVAFIGGGCRWLPLADAIKHIGKREGREEQADAMLAAKAHAKRMGWAIRAKQEAKQ
jgi:hypothetical protein